MAYSITAMLPKMLLYNASGRAQIVAISAKFDYPPLLLLKKDLITLLK